MLVPKEFLKNISKYSGFLTGCYQDKTIRWLFLSRENKTYLKNETYKLVTYKDYARSINKEIPDLYEKLKKYKSFIHIIVEGNIIKWKMPYKEDLVDNNPIQALHAINKNFIKIISANILMSPDSIIQDIYDYDELGNKDDTEYEYGPSSYSDGTWHPEHVFTKSNRNAKNPYWVPQSIEYNSELPNFPYYRGSHHKAGPGHKFAYDVYGGIPEYAYFSKIPYECPRTFRKGLTHGGKFPRWRHPEIMRYQERNISEGLPEGGNSGRHLNKPRGYDMSALYEKSYY